MQVQSHVKGAKLGKRWLDYALQAFRSGNFVQWTNCKILSGHQKQRSAKHSPDLIRHLCLYSPWTKNCFCISKELKKKFKRRMFHGMWKFHKIHIAVSTQIFIGIEHAHYLCLVHGRFCRVHIAKTPDGPRNCKYSRLGPHRRSWLTPGLMEEKS